MFLVHVVLALEVVFAGVSWNFWNGSKQVVQDDTTGSSNGAEVDGTIVDLEIMKRLLIEPEIVQSSGKNLLFPGMCKSRRQ